MALTGAASGLISVLGYAPDTFAYSVMGNWLDKYPGAQGYHYIFIMSAVFLVLATGVGLYIYSYGKKLNREKH